MNEREAKLNAIKIVMVDLLHEVTDALDDKKSGVPKKIVSEYPEIILKSIEQVEVEYEWGR